jgi:hypothetical protein
MGVNGIAKPGRIDAAITPTADIEGVCSVLWEIIEKLEHETKGISLESVVIMDIIILCLSIRVADARWVVDKKKACVAAPRIVEGSKPKRAIFCLFVVDWAKPVKG